MHWKSAVAVAASALLLGGNTGSLLVADEIRTEPHETYAAKLWTWIQGQDYKSWAKPDQPIPFKFSGDEGRSGACYLNEMAAGHPVASMPPRSVIVRERGEETGKPRSVSVYAANPVFIPPATIGTASTSCPAARSSRRPATSPLTTGRDSSFMSRKVGCGCFP